MKVSKIIITIFVISFLVTAAIIAVLRNKPIKIKEDDEDDTYDLNLDYTAASTIKIVHMEGWVNNSSGEMEKLRFLIELHPPGLDANEDIEPIDIEQNLSIHLSWCDMEPGTDYGVAGVSDLVHQNNTNRQYELDIFTTEIISDPNNDMANKGLFGQDCRIFIVIDFNDFNDSPWHPPTGSGLDPASSGTMKFMFSTGISPMIKSYTVPYFFPEERGWIDLY